MRRELGTQATCDTCGTDLLAQQLPDKSILTQACDCGDAEPATPPSIPTDDMVDTPVNLAGDSIDDNERWDDESDDEE